MTPISVTLSLHHGAILNRYAHFEQERTCSPVPAQKRISFQVVRDEVKRRIETRIWPQGSLLPTETQLAEEFNCARATVNRALRELAEQGFVERKRKSGTRVKKAPSKQAKLEISLTRQTVENQNATYRYSLVERNVVASPGWLSSQLSVSPDSRVLHVICMHYADNRPFQLEERWINIDAVPDVEHADLQETGPHEWLLDAAPFTEAEIAFCAISADSRLAEYMGTTAGTSMIQLERTTWKDGQPMTFARMTHHPGFCIRTKY
ncbi:GntR family transcriptional regulator [Roseibium sp. RKSG952]|uniref:GntR family transcriptional regulator n=1 Tax=Roseibium sp. RKSG952 TaxID=2529384 RepID=UPI0012BD0CC7|nr:GntR family transcriptional regulator [Roseibium sp. RKSG952]MTI03719.1 UTRA domain-containing protein [Roseibium sp. RKSG952]